MEEFTGWSVMSTQDGVTVETDTARLLRRQLKAADQAMARLARGEDEALHDFRVAVRRIRSRLKWHPAKTKDIRELSRNLRKLTRVSDEARNAEAWLALLDVLAKEAARQEAEGVAQVRARLMQRLRISLDDARETIEHRYPPLRADLHALVHGRQKLALPGNETAEFRVRAEALWHRLDESLAGLWPDLDEHTLHRTRLLSKRLRYWLESDQALFAADQSDTVVTELKALQTRLGDWRDAQMFGAWMSDTAAATCGAHAREMVLAAMREDVRGFAILQAHETLPGLVYLATRLSAHYSELRIQLEPHLAVGALAGLRKRMEGLLASGDVAAAADPAMQYQSSESDEVRV